MLSPIPPMSSLPDISSPSFACVLCPCCAQGGCGCPRVLPAPAPILGSVSAFVLVVLVLPLQVLLPRHRRRCPRVRAVLVRGCCPLRRPWWAHRPLLWLRTGTPFHGPQARRFAPSLDDRTSKISASSTHELTLPAGRASPARGLTTPQQNNWRT